MRLHAALTYCIVRLWSHKTDRPAVEKICILFQQSLCRIFAEFFRAIWLKLFLMKIEKLDLVRFAPKGRDSFYDAVVNKVTAYFETHLISPYANTAMWVKTIVMLLLYFTPYMLIVSGLGAGSLWLFFGLWFLMGMGMSGIGTAVMHDANHGTYSPNKKVNNFISHILEIIGGYTVTWRIQHNVLHHTYTNVAGLDEDIDSIVLLRLSPRQPRYWFHRYQYI